MPEVNTIKQVNASFAQHSPVEMLHKPMKPIVHTLISPKTFKATAVNGRQTVLYSPKDVMTPEVYG